MPTPSQVLGAHVEQSPHWLLEALPSELTNETLHHFLGSRVVYYPGSGTDGHALKLFGGARAAHCFVYADKMIALDEVIEQLQPEHAWHPQGYVPVQLHRLEMPETQQVIGASNPHNCNLHAYPEWPGAELGGAVWAILKRQEGLDDAHGPARIALLHLHAEAVWTYCQLWASRRAAPYAIVLQDHGWGGNWCPFGGNESPLFEMTQVANALPEWLFVAKNTPSWPEYVVVSDGEPGGMHETMRFLHRRH